MDYLRHVSDSYGSEYKFSLSSIERKSLENPIQLLQKLEYETPYDYYRPIYNLNDNNKWKK